MYFLGSIFLHMKVRKLWQNFSKFPKISPHDSFFSTDIICDICDKYELHRALSSVILAATAPFFRPLRDFPPNNQVGKDTRQNRALVAIIQTLGVHNDDTFRCKK